MESFGVNPVGKFLGGFNIGDIKERIIQHPIVNLFFYQVCGQAGCERLYKLRPERWSCRDTEITETKFPVNKIKIVVKVFTMIKFQRCLSCCFIMPRFISSAAFHSREDMDYTF